MVPERAGWAMPSKAARTIRARETPIGLPPSRRATILSYATQRVDHGRALPGKWRHACGLGAYTLGSLRPRSCTAARQPSARLAIPQDQDAWGVGGATGSPGP